MFKILIADDDMTVRIFLRTLLDKKADIELLDDAADGIDTLEKAGKLKPDIIILDLGMPLMNGLEVILKLKEQNFQGKIIVLSCHDDFDHVKEALKTGASDYLLKHSLKYENLFSSIDKAIGELQREGLDRDEKRKLLQISEMSYPILRDEYMKDLLVGNITEKGAIDDRRSQLGIHMEFSKYVVMVIEIDDLYKLKARYSQQEITMLFKSIERIIGEVVNGRENRIYGCIGEGCYCIIGNFEKTMSYMHINNAVFEICDNIVTNINRFLNIGVSIGLSRICQDVAMINECYSQGKLALEGKLFIGKNKIIHFSEVENYNCKLGNFLKKYEHELYNAIIKNESGISECIGKIFSDLKTQNIKPEHIRSLSFELLTFCNKLIKEYHLGYETVFGCEYLPYELVLRLETLTDIQEWFICVYLRISRQISSIEKPVNFENFRPEIKRALEYIENNFTSSITLQEISDYCNLSRIYFSQLFKKETGENYIDYLMKYRIKKAKWLLKNSQLKVYEIGLECGLGNYRYFTRLFKDITGVSPIEFRGHKEASINS